MPVALEVAANYGPGWIAPAPEGLRPRPRLELIADRLLRIEEHGGCSEVEAGLLRLGFWYGGALVDAAQPGTTLFTPNGEVPRSAAWEAEARRVLETLGPLPLEDQEAWALLPGSRADYVVDTDQCTQALVNFVASAVPRLVEQGWDVVVDPDFPVEVVHADGWVAGLEESEAPGWFELELGVEVDGKTVDLLPILVDLLEVQGLGPKRRASRRAIPVPLGGKRYLPLPPERLDALLRVVRELYEVDGVGDGRVRVRAESAGQVEELDVAVPELAWRAKDSGAVRRLLARVSPEQVQVPTELQATLRPYQLEGLAWLQTLALNGAGGVLADDMGLGKTLQTIAHLCVEKAAGRMELPSLVVAPTSLVGNWRRELAKFAPHLRVLVMHGPQRHRRQHAIADADVVITTYPLLCRDLALYEDHRFHLAILDEAQTIKNARSQAHQSVCRLDAELRLSLSGTPIENNLEELRAQFAFLMPDLLGDEISFRRRFRVPIEKGGNATRMATLRKRISPFILRRLKNTVAKDLPDKVRMTESIEIRDEQRNLYEDIRIAAHESVRGVVRKKGLAASTIDILGALMKLRQVCCDPRLVRFDAARQVESSAKFDHLMQVVPTMLAQGRRILIFSQFTRMLALISEGLQERGIRHCTLTGSTDDRQAQVDAFEHGHADVFLISLKAGGTGLNLTSADTVIHYDPWWNPAAQAQATDRAYRIGQTRKVFVYDFIVAGSVEERMMELQARKQNLADGILESGQDGTWSQQDVDSLFAALPAAAK